MIYILLWIWRKWKFLLLTFKHHSTTGNCNTSALGHSEVKMEWPVFTCVLHFVFKDLVTSPNLYLFSSPFIYELMLHYNTHVTIFTENTKGRHKQRARTPSTVVCVCSSSVPSFSVVPCNKERTVGRLHTLKDNTKMCPTTHLEQLPQNLWLAFEATCLC